jgi:hypothetical protein
MSGSDFNPRGRLKPYVESLPLLKISMTSRARTSIATCVINAPDKGSDSTILTVRNIIARDPARLNIATVRTNARKILKVAFQVDILLFLHDI